MAKKRKIEESIEKTLSGYVGDMLHILVLVYVFVILLVLPFYFTNGYEKIGTDKAEIFRWWIEKLQWFAIPLIVAQALLMLAVVVKGNRKAHGDLLEIVLKNIKTDFSVTDRFALVFAIGLLLSYVFSEYKDVARWGSIGWYMGLLPYLAVLISYFLISRYLKNGRWLISCGLIASFGIFLLGILNRFEIRPFDFAYANPAFLSTIGNINWYCGYQVALFFIGPVFLWMGYYKNRFQKIFLIIYSWVGFMSLVLQGSDSGIVALFGFFCLLFLFSCENENVLRRFWEQCIIFFAGAVFLTVLRKIFPNQISYTTEFLDLFTLSVFSIGVLILFLALWWGTGFLEGKNCLSRELFRKVRFGFLLFLSVVFVGCVLLIVVKTNNPHAFSFLPDNFFVLSDTWGSNRGATWKAGWMCFADAKPLHKVFGQGPDCMYSFISRTPNNRIMKLCTEIFQNAKLTNAHNEWLTILVNNGIIGLVGFAGMMISAMVRFLKKGKECPWAFACGICLFTHTVNCMFSFQQTLNLTIIFVILGVGEACYRNELSEKKVVCSVR